MANVIEFKDIMRKELLKVGIVSWAEPYFFSSVDNKAS